MTKRRIFIPIIVLALFVLSCSLLTQYSPQSAPVPTVVATTILNVTTIVEPTSAPRSDLPRDEDAVARIPVEQAKAALDSGAAIIVDVRNAQAYDLEHIAGSISIPLVDIEINPKGLTLDKQQWIITYCTWQNEHTSARAAFVMIQNGYENVAALLGGLQSWVDAGYPVEP